MLYIISSCLIYFVTRSLYLLIPFPYLAHSPTHLPCGNHHIVLFSESVSVQFCSFFQIPCISGIVWYLSFFVLLISLSIIPSRFISVVANGKISFFFMANIPLYILNLLYPFIYQWTLSIHLLMYPCFCNLAIVNSAAVNIGCVYLFELVYCFSFSFLFFW